MAARLEVRPYRRILECRAAALNVRLDSLSAYHVPPISMIDTKPFESAGADSCVVLFLCSMY